MNIVTKVVLLGCMLFFSSVFAQVAPGDEDVNCKKRNTPYDDNVIMLMDSRNYQDLLHDSGAVWDEQDYDDNNSDDLYNPTSFQHNAGGVCRWSVMSCGYEHGFQNNWLFTQFINKTVPKNTNYTVAVTVALTYTLSSCRPRHGCNPEISLFKFYANVPQHRSVYTNRNNYELVLKRPGASTRSQNVLLNVDIVPEVQGFYFAVKDNTSCIQVSRLQIYRHQCPQKQEGLVIFPETAAPAYGVLIVNVQCMPNSSPVTGAPVICNGTGYWHGSVQCVCNPGYVQKVDSEENEFCEACPAGTYRGAEDSQDKCKPCPANTISSVVAASVCQCLTSYFRNQIGLNETCPGNQIYENTSSDCSKPPGRPVDLQADEITMDSISVSWSPPTFLGDRQDIYYTVEHSHHSIPSVMLPASCGGNCLVDTNCTISSLQPATTYAIIVTAHNGVSDQDKDGEFGRLLRITLQTDFAPPSAPPSVYHTCDLSIVVWDKPTLPNGNISRYDIAISFGNDSNDITIFEVEGQNTYYLLENLFYLQELYEVKVRAVNEAGPGPYTISTPLDCFNDSGLISEADATDVVECPIPSPSPTETVSVPTTTVTSTVSVTNTVTKTEHIPTTVPTTNIVEVLTTVTATATVTNHITETTTAIVTSTETTTLSATPSPTTSIVEVPTTVTATATVTNHVTETTTAIVTSTETTTLSATPKPCPTVTPVESPNTSTSEVPQLPTMLLTCPDPEPCDSCCQPCEECTPCEPDIIQTTCPSPTTCPTCGPPPECPSCPSFTFHASPDCAKRDRRPGDIRNVQMMDCGMIVWDAPEDVDCCHDIITYRIKFYNGTSYQKTHPTQRGTMHVSNSWVHLTAADLPRSRPLRIEIRSRKQDGMNSPNWVEAGTVTDSYVMDCASHSK